MTRRVSSPIFVGRRIERERLWGALAEARAGRPGVVLVAGEAGVGKTRLVAEFEAGAAATGARVLHGACVPVGDRSLPFAPFTDAFGHLFRSTPGADLARVLGSARIELPLLLPGLALGSARAPHDPEQQHGRLLELIVDCLRRLSVVAPVVLVLEDLHWADLATMGALDVLVRRLRAERMLLVGTYRTDEPVADHRLASLVTELDRAARVELLELRRLDLDELHAMVAGILGTEPDMRLVAGIHARSGGNAYFAEELLALDAIDGPLPATMREALLARVDGVASSTSTLLRVAAVIGSRFDPRLIAQAGGLDEPAAEAALRDAVARHLVVPVDDPARAFGFRHALLAEAVYEVLLPAERRRLHAAVADAIAGGRGPTPDGLAVAQLARHWDAAGDLPRALEASVLAGREAMAVHASADAHLHFERALRLWTCVPDPGPLAGIELPELLEMAALAARNSGAFGVAVEHLRAAIGLVDPALDPVRAGMLHEQLGSAAARLADGTMLAAYREAVRLVPAAPPTAARARTLAGLARGLMYAAAWDAAASTAQEALRVARAAGVPAVEADALATLGAVQGSIGSFAAALDTLRRGRDIALQAGNDEAVARAWNNLAWLLEGEECVRESRAAVEWDERAGLGPDAGVGTLEIAATALFHLGRWEYADRVLDRAERSGREPAARMSIRIVRGRLAMGRGRTADVARILEEEGPVAQSHHDASWRIVASELEAQLWLQRGRPHEARRAIEPALREFDLLPIRSVSVQGDTVAIALRVEAECAREARARRDPAGLAEACDRGAGVLRRARDVAAMVARDGPAGPRRPVALAALCAAEWTRLEGVPDPSAWEAARDACEAAEQLHLAVYAAYRQAEAILDTPRGRAAAGPVLRRAHEAAARMGARPLGDAIDALASRAGIGLEPGLPPPPGARLAGARRDGRRPPAPFGLTPREQQVLTLVADGRTNREIAAALFISEGTAAIHVSSILGKLGVARRTEAAAAAHRMGLDRDAEASPDRPADPRGSV